METLGLDHHDLPPAKTTEDLARMLQSLRSALGATVAVDCHRPSQPPKVPTMSGGGGGLGSAGGGGRGGTAGRRNKPLLDLTPSAPPPPAKKNQLGTRHIATMCVLSSALEPVRFIACKVVVFSHVL